MQTFTLQRWLGGFLRRMWIVTAITVAACAAFAARAAAALLAAETLAPAPRAPARLTVAPAPPIAPARPGVGDQLVARNMFCSACDLAVPGAAGVDLVLVPAVLIETSVGGEPRATLRVVASEVQGSWGLGDEVPGLGRLDRIAPQWIELVGPTGRRGRLSLLEPAAGRGSDTAMSESPPAATPWAGRIRQLDEQTYEVDRDLVRELVGSMTKAGGARFVPIMTDGALKGVRLFGVTATTIPSAIGLKNRDALTSIDGQAVTSPQQVIDLYAKLDQLSSVELSGTRDGKPLVRTLRLR
jgi:hypothetical protein